MFQLKLKDVFVVTCVKPLEKYNFPKKKSSSVFWSRLQSEEEKNDKRGNFFSIG